MYDIILLSDGEYIYPVVTQEELTDGINIGFHLATDQEIDAWIDDELPNVTIH